MSDPKFSVIIPTYNRAYVLERAINSVLEQSLTDYELIIVDDGSTDETKALITKYPQIRYFYQKNAGVSCARNLGVEKSNGDWISFLDSDDQWLPHKLELQWKFIESHPHIFCVHGEEVWYRNNKRVNPKKKHQKGGGDQFIPSLSLCLISPSTVVIRRDVFEKLGGFREDFVVCEDYDLWLRLTSLYEIGFIETPLINKYGGHEDQLSHKYKAMDYYRVCSMEWILSNRELAPNKYQACIDTLIYKCEILIAGYRKHNQLSKLSEIETLLSKYL